MMSIVRSQLQQRLKDGIDAVKSGNRVRGRDQLPTVVRHDRNVELAGGGATRLGTTSMSGCWRWSKRCG